MAKQAPYKKLKVAYEDIERQISDGDEIENETIPASLQKAIVAQVNEEYEVAFPHTEAKRKVQLARLKLYNNQRRDPDKVGDPLMFTVFNTVLASLYSDRLDVSFQGRSEDDEDVEENLNALAEYDYDVMGKSELDYYWDWDTCFFGRGLLLMMDFDREVSLAPVPELIDPVTWIRDPRATSVNGDPIRGKGSMRFGGYETGATYYELKKLNAYFNINSLRKDKEIRSLLSEARQAREDAQGRENFSQREETLGKRNNYEFNLLNWFTTVQGEKYLITLGNQRSVLTRLVKLDDYGGRWPMEDRTLYPMSNDWDGVCIPDFTEDKQRMRAVLLNLGVKAAIADAMPRYLFDRNRIKNKNELNYRAQKYIGVDGSTDGAIAAIQKSNPSQFVSAIMDSLDQAAQRAMATPEIQQGVPSADQRTLGELQLVSSKVDTRYSMSAKIFGWSEKGFWRQWYRQYKIHFKDGIDEKIIRIQGLLAPTWRPLARENIISDADPDVKVESRIVSDAKRQKELNSFERFAGLAMQDPANNRRWIQKKLGKLNGLKKEEIDQAFPPTIDELQAEDENELLNAKKLPPVGVQDDHLTHIHIHAKAEQNAQTIAHIRAHKKLMVAKRNRPDLFPPPVAPGFQQPGSKSIPTQQATPGLAAPTA